MATTAQTTLAKTVDEYLEGVPEDMRNILEVVRNAIKAAAPKAEEKISYRIPTYTYKGPVVHFAAFENHCSLIVVSPSITTAFKKELEGYKISGRTIHFTPDTPLPATLVKKIVKARIRENEASDALKKVKK